MPTTASGRAAVTSRTTSATNGGRLAPLVSQRQSDRGARLGGRGRAAQRVLGVVAPGVEEVLGVVHHALALRHEKADRLVDHAQVLVAADADDLAQVQAPRLADDGDGRREDLGEHAQALVGLGRDALAPGHAEGDELGVDQPLCLHAPEELDLLGVRGREAALDEADAELVELERDARLLVDRDGHALLLHAVAERRVVQLHLLLAVTAERCAYGAPLDGPPSVALHRVLPGRRIATSSRTPCSRRTPRRGPR